MTMENYKNGKIYAIRSRKNIEHVYYGSTFQDLEKRMLQHNSDAVGVDRFRSSAMIISCGDAYIELVEEFPCNTKQELEKREGWYQKNKMCVNKKVAGRTDSEYREDNRETIRKNWHDNRTENNAKQRERHNNNKHIDNMRSHKYYNENKTDILEHQKERYQENKKDILGKERDRYASDKEYREKKKASAVKYAKEHSTEKQEYLAEYFKNNKDKIKQQQAERKLIKGFDDEQKRRNKAALKKNMSLEDMFQCPNCPARYASKPGLSKHLNTNVCKRDENSILKDAVVKAFKKFEIGPVKVDGCKIEAPFRPHFGVVVLEQATVATSSIQPILHLSIADIKNVESLIEDFILDHDET